MYLHLGGDYIIKTRNILGIFDIDNTSLSKNTRTFLHLSEKNGKVINVTNELPKSFIVTNAANETKVYISQISATTLKKRSGYIDDIKIEKK
ncbi:MAG: DUF370 domain-containing protein [Oscillospiraceae bacterium]